MNTDEQNKVSAGELIDSMSIDEIINHPNFYQLRVFKGIFEGGDPDYWEVTFKSDKRTAKGWLTFRCQEIPYRLYSFYKTKK